MAAITVRELDDEVKELLRVQAAQHGRSMEAEARAIIELAVKRPQRAKNIGVALIELGDRFGAIDPPARDRALERTRDPFAGDADS